MKKLIFVLLLFSSGCMTPHITTMAGETFTVEFDPSLSSIASVRAYAETACQERFGKSAIEVHADTGWIQGGFASYECR